MGIASTISIGSKRCTSAPQCRSNLKGVAASQAQTVILLHLERKQVIGHRVSLSLTTNCCRRLAETLRI